MVVADVDTDPPTLGLPADSEAFGGSQGLGFVQTLSAARVVVQRNPGILTEQQHQKRAATGDQSTRNFYGLDEDGRRRFSQNES